jgi:hypothetical protein
MKIARIEDNKIVETGNVNNANDLLTDFQKEQGWRRLKEIHPEAQLYEKYKESKTEITDEEVIITYDPVEAINIAYFKAESLAKLKINTLSSRRSIIDDEKQENARYSIREPDSSLKIYPDTESLLIMKTIAAFIHEGRRLASEISEANSHEEVNNLMGSANYPSKILQA